jgi:uncharacterized protein (TIGR02271 family)
MDSQRMEVVPGAVVEARDGRLGTADEVVVRPESGELAYLVVRRGWTDEQLVIPAELVEAIDDPQRVRLRVTREEAAARAASVPPEALLARREGTELRIPIAEERLSADARPVDLGELRVHKRVDEREERVRRPVTRDDLVVERVAINQPIEAPRPRRMEGDTLVIPIMEEVLVVRKQLMLKEEVRISTRRVTEEQEVTETVRRERVELEDATAHGVHGLPEGGPDAGPAEPGPTEAGPTGTGPASKRGP